MTPNTGAYYGEGGASFERITYDLERAPLSFSSPDKKYLVYYDGPVESHHVCGTSPLGPARASGLSVVFLDSGCGSDLGTAGEAAAAAVHKLIHNLAARPRMHGCSGTTSHVCDSSSDILYWAVESGALLSNLRLDVGHDESYYELARRTVAGGRPRLALSRAPRHGERRIAGGAARLLRDGVGTG